MKRHRRRHHPEEIVRTEPERVPDQDKDQGMDRSTFEKIVGAATDMVQALESLDSDRKPLVQRQAGENGPGTRNCDQEDAAVGEEVKLVIPSEVEERINRNQARDQATNMDLFRKMAEVMTGIVHVIQDLDRDRKLTLQNQARTTNNESYKALPCAPPLGPITPSPDKSSRLSGRPCYYCDEKTHHANSCTQPWRLDGRRTTTKNPATNILVATPHRECADCECHHAMN